MAIFKQVQRYAEITNIFVKYGFRDIIRQLKIESEGTFTKKILSHSKDEEDANTHDKWVRLRLALEELGPTFIKLGQIISSRPDQFPAALVKEMEGLQDAIPAFPFEEAKIIVEEELRTSLQSVFKVFESEPMASESIAQVHKAILINDQHVAVKVQRPGIVDKILVDLEIMKNLAGLMEKYMDEMRTIKPVALVESFEKSIKEELNFENEALNIRRFAGNFSESNIVYIPKVFRAYTTQKVLVMEYIQGTKISDLEKLDSLNLNKDELADKIAELSFNQFFETGFFHADPHPGNVVALTDGRICYLDFGMMGKIQKREREILSSVFIGIQRNDASRVTRALKRLALNSDIHDSRKLQFDVQDLIDEYVYVSIGEIKLGNILMKFKAVLIENNIQVPPDLFLLIRALAISEGVVTKLVPNFDIIKKMEPFVEQMMQERFAPDNIYKEVKFALFDSYSSLQRLPYDLEEIFYKIRKGKMHVEFEHKGLQPFIDRVDIASNRLVLAIILASVVIGSSIIVHSHIPPTYKGVPVIGVFGYLIASILGLGLIINILRYGRLK